MSPLNRYQRRQAQRRLDAIMLASLFLTIMLFGIGYVCVRQPIIQSMYQEVLDSNGTRTFGQVQDSRLMLYAVPFVITWFVIALIMVWRAGKQHNNFDFGEQITVPQGRANRRAINYHKLSPREFEELIASLIARQGYRTKVVGGGGDQGVDVKVYNTQGRLIGVVQCKRFRPGTALPPMYVRELATVQQMHGVNIAYLATTTYFTESTKRLAKELNVRLIDGHDLKHIGKTVAAPPPSQYIQSVITQSDPNARFRRPVSSTKYPFHENEYQSQSAYPISQPQPQRNTNIPQPIVRNAPPPIRRTPGTDNQYGEQVPTVTFQQRSLTTSSSYNNASVQSQIDREALRRSRDAQQRRQQSDEELNEES